jgi:hypothetical protein
MAMTRKHYKAVAQILNESYKCPWIENPEYSRQLIEHIAYRLSQEVFKPDNPNHDINRFITAVKR